MIVSNVEPVVASNTVLKEGRRNAIPLDLNVNYVDNEETTDVSGEGLWTTRMWMSSDEQGLTEINR